MEYEYLTVHFEKICEESKDGTLSNGLNEYGKNGWELCCVSFGNDYIFKRPLLVSDTPNANYLESVLF